MLNGFLDYNKILVVDEDKNKITFTRPWEPMLISKFGLEWIMHLRK